MRLQNNDLLIKGRGDVNLPRFKSPEVYRRYGLYALGSFDIWLREFLAVNQIASKEDVHHAHRPPRKITLATDGDQPELVVRGTTKREQRENHSHAMSGSAHSFDDALPRHYVHSTRTGSIAVAREGDKDDLKRIFTAKEVVSPAINSLTVAIGNAREIYDRGCITHETRPSPEINQQRYTLVRGVLARFGYDEAAFTSDAAFTFEEYSAQVCAEHDRPS